jgi:hypothetical protein
MKLSYKLILSCLAVVVMSCKETFLFHPSTVQPTVDNYYNNAEQVYGATGLLYNNTWDTWSDKAFTSVGDVLGGTVTGVAGNSQYNSFYNFNIQSTDGLIADTWYSCYKAAGNASVLIQTFEAKKGQIGDQPFLTIGIAEARFVRAFAYFYIGRAFGDAPIVPSPLDLTKPGQSLVPRHLQKDVLRFAIEDLQFAEANLPEESYQPARVNKYSAKGLMAKIYLYLKDYDKAKAKAKEVIDYANSTGKIGLHPNYQELFTSSKVAIGNKESLFALQWTSIAGWNGGNRFMTYAAPKPLVGPAPTSSGAGYSSVVPSFDMLDPITGYHPGDNRRQGSVMEHGFFRADWKNDSYPNGFRYDTTGQTTNNQYIFTGTRSNILKYVVGPNRSIEPVTPDSHSSMPTFILRYADVLLIYAEAVMNGAGSTSDAQALAAYNAVHTRAGLPTVSSITIDDLLHERKVEFAFEGDYWFDIQRQGKVKASQMVAAQERGTKGADGFLNSFKATIPANFNMFLPIPQNETVSNPLLLQPAVPFYTN